eukprot:6484146-Amphidinium_carterae.1
MQADTQVIGELLDSKEQDSNEVHYYEEDLHYIPKKIVSVVTVDAAYLPEPRFTEGQLAGRFWTFAPLISMILVMGGAFSTCMPLFHFYPEDGGIRYSFCRALILVGFLVVLATFGLAIIPGP